MCVMGGVNRNVGKSGQRRVRNRSERGMENSANFEGQFLNQ